MSELTNIGESYNRTDTQFLIADVLGKLALLLDTGVEQVEVFAENPHVPDNKLIRSWLKTSWFRLSRVQSQPQLRTQSEVGIIIPRGYRHCHVEPGGLKENETTADVAVTVNGLYGLPTTGAPIVDIFDIGLGRKQHVEFQHLPDLGETVINSAPLVPIESVSASKLHTLRYHMDVLATTFDV